MLLGMIGCASQDDRASVDIPIEEKGSRGAEEQQAGLTSADYRGENPAVATLLQSAENAYEHKDLERAAAFSERAIRIAPASPRAYFMLAQIRFAQAQYALSDTLLSKARSLTTESDLLRAIDRFASANKLNR